MRLAPALVATLLACGAVVAASPDASSLDAVRALNEQGNYREAEAEARALVASAEVRRGPESMAVAEALDELVIALVRGGRTRDAGALELAERALALKASLHGEASAEAAASLFNLARVLRSRGRLGEALEAHERSLSLREQALGIDHPDVAMSLVYYGQAAFAQGDGERAETMYRRAREIFERAHGPRSRGVALALRMEADLHIARLDLERAIELHGRSLKIRREVLGPDHPDLAMNHNNIGLALVRLGEYARADTEYVEAARIWETALGPDHPRVATALLNRGRLFWFGQIDVPTARSLFLRALAIQEAALGPEHPDVADILDNYGGLLHYTGDFAGSMPLFERALAIRETAEGPRSLRVASSLVSMAQFDREMGEGDRATARLERAVLIYEDSLGPDHPRLAVPLGEMGSWLLGQGRHAEAGPVLERAVSVLEGAPLGVAVQSTDAIHALARLRSRANRPAEAYELDRRAIAIREEALGPDSPLVAGSLVRAAGTLSEQGRAADARALLKRAIGILEEAFGAGHPRTVRARHAMALLAFQDGDPGGVFKEALDLESESRDHLRLALRGLAERQALGYAATRTSGLDLALSVSAAGRTKPASVRDLWDSVARSRAIVLDEMASRHRSVGASEDVELSAVFDELASVRNHLAYLALQPARRMDPSAYRRTLSGLENRKARLEAELGRRSASFRAETERAAVGLEDALAHLPGDAALVAFVRYRHLAADGSMSPYYAVFVRPRGKGAPLFYPIGPAAEVDRLVEAYRDETGRRPAALGGEAEPSGSGAALRRAVWDPVGAVIGEADRVFIVPDGALHGVSFAALPVDTGYLVETGPTLHYLSAERDLVRPDRGQTDPSLLAMGAPDFGDRAPFLAEEAPAWAGRRMSAPSAKGVYRGPVAGCAALAERHFEPLPEARIELEAVASLWSTHSPAGEDAALMLRDGAAREAFFKRLAPGRSVLHIATHGFFAEAGCEIGIVEDGSEGEPEGIPLARGDNPLLLSGLVLAGANEQPELDGEREDGFLTAEEIAALDLSSVSWAVLSGCDTGRGSIVAGEGVLGLRRAFEIAGADTLVLSLWRVDDAAARAWMLALYQARLEGLSTAAAVRRASLEVIAERREAGLAAHPFYWAGFVATGDWR